MRLIIISVSLEEARGSSKKLQELVSEALKNDEAMAQRIDRIDTQTMPPSIQASIGTTTIRREAESLSTPVLDNSSFTATGPQTQYFRFAFENDLLSSRVYGRVTHKHSYMSLTSSAGKSRGWSFLSDLALSEVSNVSVLFLPISTDELYNGDDYPSLHAQRAEMHSLISDRKRPSSWEGFQRRTRLLHTLNTDIGKGIPPQHLLEGSAIFMERTFTVRSIDATEAAITWPPPKVAAWMGRTSLSKSVLGQFVTDDMSGFSITFMRPDNLITIGITDLLEQACLWAEVQQLQTIIFNELLSKQITTKKLIPSSGRVQVQRHSTSVAKEVEPSLPDDGIPLPWPLPNEPLLWPLFDPVNSDDLSPPAGSPRRANSIIGAAY